MFDAKKAKALAASAHLTIDHCPGLRLEATQKFRTWTYRYKSPLDGKMKQVKLGQWPAMSLHQAIAAWQEKREARDQGEDVAAAKKKRRDEERAEHQAEVEKLRTARVTVADILDDYASHVRGIRKKKGADSVAWAFNTLCGAIRDMPVTSVSRSVAHKFIESHQHTPVQAMSLKGELARAWDYAYDREAIPDACPNWWRQVFNGRLRSKGKIMNGQHEGQKSQRALSEAELAQVIPFFPNCSEAVADVLTLYVWTGTRGCEIVAMEGAEISVEDKVLWWTIPLRKTKNARRTGATDLRVPLVGRAREVVERRCAQYGKGYLFPSKNQKAKLPHIEQKSVQGEVYWFMPYCQTRPTVERARWPVANWSPHDLRRTTRTLLSSLGCADEIAEAIIGHMVPGIKGVYNKYRYDKERLEWLTRWDKHLMKLLKT